MGGAPRHRRGAGRRPPAHAARPRRFPAVPPLGALGRAQHPPSRAPQPLFSPHPTAPFFPPHSPSSFPPCFPQAAPGPSPLQAVRQDFIFKSPSVFSFFLFSPLVALLLTCWEPGGEASPHDLCSLSAFGSAVSPLHHPSCYTVLQGARFSFWGSFCVGCFVS